MTNDTLSKSPFQTKAPKVAQPEWSASEYEEANEGQFQAAFHAMESINAWNSCDKGYAADIGCGSGRLVETLARNGGWKVDAKDVSQSMIDAVIKRCEGLPVTASVCDASDLSLEKNKYSLVSSCWMLHWLENTDNTLEQMVNALTPSGNLVLQWSCGQPRSEGFLLRDTLQEVFDRPKWAERLKAAPLAMYHHPIEEMSSRLESMGLEIVSTRENIVISGGENIEGLKRSLRSAAFAAQTVVLGDDVDELIDESLYLLHERNALHISNTEIIARKPQ